MQPLPAGSWCKSVLRRSFRPFVLFGLGLPAAAQVPIASFTTQPSPAAGASPFTVQFLDLSTGAVTSWTWDFGDGGPGSTLPSPVHVFTPIQAFNVTLNVKGPGGSDSFTLLHAVDVLPSTNGIAGAPPALATMVVPTPRNLGDFVRDPAAALRLGKALFWDMQVGSDGLTACGSCHYHAGVDNRRRNTLHPGADGRFDALASQRGGGPNHALSSGDFPFEKFVDPNDGEDLIQSTDDRRGTAGVLAKNFVGTSPALEFDLGEDKPDPTFQVGGLDTLQTTARDAPTTIGAIFFHRLFWDGRANSCFNGKNIWGNADPSQPTVLEMRSDGSLGEVRVLLEDAAAASQAVGPPLSDVEMSWAGRAWNDIGRKLVNRRPLASQHVDLSDGVLGALANPAGPGLRAGSTYADLIRAAFLERWWGSLESRDGFTQMEANFSLFFGLAIQAYEATLVPDRAPYDRWANGDLSALSESALRGLQLFVGAGRCIGCHATPAFAGALRDEVRVPDAVAEGALELMPMKNAIVAGGTVFSADSSGLSPDGRAAGLYDASHRLLAWAPLPAGLRCAPAGSREIALQPTAFVPAGAEFLAELRFTTDGKCGLQIELRYSWNTDGPAPGAFELRLAGKRMGFTATASAVAVYDNGFYNLGVRPTSDDLGVGANGAFGPLSLTRRAQAGEDVGRGPGAPSVAWFQRVAVDGAFKTPTLRNVELTGPYMHNGSMASLEQVVEFYARGGNFPDANARDQAPEIAGIPGLSEPDKADLVAFLESLTDPRVRFEQAPFDHPELILKVGQVGDQTSVLGDGEGNAIPELVVKPSTGFAGGGALQSFAESLPASVTAVLIEEDANGARVGFTCDKQPSADVTIFLKLSRPRVASLSSDVVTFTPASWRVGQIVTLSARDPASAGTALLLHTSRAHSADLEFSGLDVADVVLDFVPNPTPNTNGSGPTAAGLAPGGASLARTLP
jgi:cytochrome c peroxidase